MSSGGPPARRPLKVQPKNVARKSKAERDALDRAEAERKRARAEAAAADAAAEASRRRAEYGLPSNDRGDRGRGRGGQRHARGGRGGFMGQGPRIISRPSLPQFATTSNRPRPDGFSGGGGGGGGSRSSGPSIKREPNFKQDFDEDIAMLGIPGLKRDPDASDDERVFGGKDVDRIDLVTDDENDENDDDTVPGGRATNSSRNQGAPIRLQRKEHKDRVAGINTESSSTTAAVLRKTAEESRKSGQTSSLDEALTSATRKLKTRSKDVEHLGDRRRWKGVWEDADDDIPINIKEEPVDEPMGFAPEHITSESRPVDASTEVEGSSMQVEPDSKAAVRAKLKQKHKSNTVRPAIYQTTEEIREWEKRLEDLATIQEELGSLNLANDNSQEDGVSQSKDVEGDSGRKDAVYLFQLPTILPDLVGPVIKKEPVSPTLGRNNKTAQPSTAESAEEVPIKIEDDDIPGEIGTSRRRKLSLAAGHAGKLRIHKSGRATLSWGGTNMEMKMGVSPYFLQTAIMTKLTKEEKKKEDVKSFGSSKPTNTLGGEAISFGQIRGKLVVVPAWSEILGERGLA